MPFMLGLILCVHSVSALNFDTDTVIEVKLNNRDTAERSYFGYTLLLQRGKDLRNSRVIVGSPKQSSQTGGAVFGCKIDLDSHECTKYKISATNKGSVNGNFLGASIDGGENVDDPFVACAFRRVVSTGYDYWQKGRCFYQSNSSVINQESVDINPLNNESFFKESGTIHYPTYGLGQAGFDVFYNKDSLLLYLGAPGILNWFGSVVIQPLEPFTKPLKHVANSPIIIGRYLQLDLNNEYLGYKITYGSFNGKKYLIASAPRGGARRGRVVLFDESKSYKVDQSIEGEEFGSYFGASVLAVNVRNKESDVLFVGAPMTKNKKTSFEEGCVYYYKDVSKSKPIRLFGSTDKPRARFGTNIVSLGDIDLDTYNDIAISAPFEDDGVGAVYIFKGPIDEINTPTFSQRLSPLTFSGNFKNIRGFGMGLSRGVDVDGNGFNDLAIGAYRSGQAFLIRTKPIIDFHTNLTANVSSILNNSDVLIKYCIRYTLRATDTKLAPRSVNVQIKLKLDYRGEGEDPYVRNIPSGTKEKCQTFNVLVKQVSSNISPFKYTLSTQVLDNSVFVQMKNMIERTIPYVHGCNSDNICQTDINLYVTAPSDTIILGENRSVTFNVTATNEKEPGYECRLFIKHPAEVALKLDKRCDIENSTYNCLFANQLNSYSSLLVPFDIISNDVSLEMLKIDFDLKCLGEPSHPANTSIALNVVLHNSVYLEGMSDPESVQFFDQDTNDEQINIIHTFTVGNSGPSPAKTDIYFLLPTIRIGNEDLFLFADVTNNEAGNKVSCNRSVYINNDLRNEVPKYDDLKAPLNRTIIVDCHQKYDCLTMFCTGGVLDKSTQTEKYSLKFSINPKLLAVFLKNKPEEKDILAYISSAIINNGAVIDSHIPILILSSHKLSVPLWVYIVGAMIGLPLLCLLIFLLFKCKFFKREYKEKLDIEKLILENSVKSPCPEIIAEEIEDGEKEEEEERLEIEEK